MTSLIRSDRLKHFFLKHSLLSREAPLLQCSKTNWKNLLSDCDCETPPRHCVQQLWLCPFVSRRVSEWAAARNNKFGWLKLIVCCFILMIKSQKSLRGSEWEAQALNIQKANEAVPFRYAVHQGHRLCFFKVQALCVPPTQLYNHFPTFSQQLLLFAVPRRLLQDYMDEAAHTKLEKLPLPLSFVELAVIKQPLFMLVFHPDLPFIDISRGQKGEVRLWHATTKALKMHWKIANIQRVTL